MIPCLEGVHLFLLVGCVCADLKSQNNVLETNDVWHSVIVCEFMMKQCLEEFAEMICDGVGCEGPRRAKGRGGVKGRV